MKLIVAPAIRPAAAAETTCAWGSVMLPATQTPGTAVAPVRSASMRVPIWVIAEQDLDLLEAERFEQLGASLHPGRNHHGVQGQAAAARQHDPGEAASAGFDLPISPSAMATPRASSRARCSASGVWV